MAENDTAGEVIHSRHYDEHHRAFRGHFPGRPVLPGVFFVGEMLTMLPPALASQPYTIRQAKFISMVTPGTDLDYIVCQKQPRETGQVDIVTSIRNSSQKTVAKIHLVFNAGDQHAD